MYKNSQTGELKSFGSAGKPQGKLIIADIDRNDCIHSIEVWANRYVNGLYMHYHKKTKPPKSFGIGLGWHFRETFGSIGGCLIGFHGK